LCWDLAAIRSYAVLNISEKIKYILFAAFPDIGPAISRKCNLRILRRHIGRHLVKYLLKKVSEKSEVEGGNMLRNWLT